MMHASSVCCIRQSFSPGLVAPPFDMLLVRKREILTRKDEDHKRSRIRPKEKVTRSEDTASGLTEVSLDEERAPRTHTCAGVARPSWDQDELLWIPSRSHLGRDSFSCSLSNWPVVLCHGIPPSGIVLAGGSPAWHSPRMALLQANATVGQRMTFMKETQGWLASDELSHVVGRMRQRRSTFTILPTAFYNPQTDDFCFEHDHAHIPNTGVSFIPVLFGAHWIGIEVDRQHNVPKICILQAPLHFQQRPEFMVCRMMQIPAHRLHISHGLDASPPNMCGWGLLCRWMRLMHAKHSLRDVLQRLQSLADVNRRIIHRAMQESINAWAVTQADSKLQQVAYTLRLSFLVHLFQFDVNIHSRLDSLAICAAGQPSDVYDVSATVVGSALSQGHDPAQGSGAFATDPASAPEVHDVSHRTVETQTEGMTIHPTESHSLVSCRVTDAVWHRLQVMCRQPDWASSDEIDFAARFYQPFLHNVVILPCLTWDSDKFELQSISGTPIFYGSADSVDMLTSIGSWLALTSFMTSFVSAFLGAPLSMCMSLTHCCIIFRSYSNVFLPQAQVHFFQHESPFFICGYAVLWSFLISENFTWVPFPELAVSALQVCPYHQLMTQIGNDAMTSWQQATQNRPLILFAFAILALYLHDMVCNGTSSTSFVLLVWPHRGMNYRTCAVEDPQNP